MGDKRQQEVSFLYYWDGQRIVENSTLPESAEMCPRLWSVAFIIRNPDKFPEWLRSICMDTLRDFLAGLRPGHVIQQKDLEKWLTPDEALQS